MYLGGKHAVQSSLSQLVGKVLSGGVHVPCCLVECACLTEFTAFMSFFPPRPLKWPKKTGSVLWV